MYYRFSSVFFRQFIIWTFAVVFWSLLRNFGQEVVREFEPMSIWHQIAAHLLLGCIAGLFFSVLEIAFNKYIFRKMSLTYAVIIGAIGYLVICYLFVFITTLLLSKIISQEVYWYSYKDFLFANQTILLVVYFSIIINLNSFFLEIDKKLGRGNLWKMLKGDFYHPKEEHRIFLFIDLKSSTAIAEKIGHFKYSRLIQDCFKDLSIIEKYNAEIYQFVGDEVVLTWKTEKGLQANKCIEAFFAFQDALTAHKTHYQNTYGLMPQFKAGMHLGKIITAEVGELKREIAYHGDTINTASRMQEACKTMDSQLLISHKMLTHIKNPEAFTFEFKDELFLKGKKQPVKLFNVLKK